MKTWPAGLADSTTRTELMEIQRRDGRLFRFTVHDADIVAMGARYRAGQGFDRSAIGSSTDFTGQDAQVRAFFESVGLTAQEISIGKFDGARIRIYAVDFEDPTLVGEVFEGVLGQFQGQLGNFDAQILSFIHVLEIEQGEFTTPECPYDLGDYRCTIPLDPPVVCRSTPYSLGQFVKVPTGLARTVVSLTLTNADFDDATLAPWVTVRGNPARATSDGGLSPFEGAAFLAGAATSLDGYLIRRVENLVGVTGFVEAEVDNREVSLEASIQRANGGSDVRDSGAVRIEAWDEDGNALGVLWDYEATSGPRLGLRSFEIVSPANAWQIRSCAGRVLPVGTRQLAIFLEGVTRNGSKCNAAFDDLQIRLIRHGAAYTQAAYENRIYEVTAAGTTSSTAPTFNETPGATTTDGSVVFTAREAWTRHAVVASVISSTVLEVTVDETRASADGWFDNGVLGSESGDNAIAPFQRIKSWDGSSQQLELFTPFPFDFEVGDLLILAKGCRKRRVDCQEFTYDAMANPGGNILNFGGFPDLPGEDAISQSPMILTS